ncbi:agamous-like MADS-box protein MADS2 [Quercus robur]|uniref:agamous-like MADS-box protein MADS2 n=1 Tax=Quercus robur TaxID=38942 RepID=UPI002161C2D2|nr:agamous-like MADS-box protein MADS2 [Quercus robur]
MGRGKLTMKLMESEKSRNVTFQKRKKGLMKKAYEFSTLCGVETCMIIYGPKLQIRPMELETWPQNHEEVVKMINKYKVNIRHKRSRGSTTSSDIFQERNKKVDIEISRLRKNIFNAKYPTWDDRIETLPRDQLMAVLDVLDAKFEAMTRRMKMLQGKQLMVGGNVSHNPELTKNHFDNMQMQALRCQDSSIKPLDIQWPTQFQTTQGSHMVPIDKSHYGDHMDNSFLNLLYGEDWTQFNAVPSNNIVQYAPLNDPSNYNMIHGMLENTILNNPSASMNYYDLTRQFSTPQYVQYPMLPNISSQMPGFQVNELYDISQFNIKNKNAMI